MSHNLTEATTWDTPVAVPDDGDAADVASVNPSPFQKVANRTAFLNALVEGTFLGAWEVFANVEPGSMKIAVSALDALAAGNLLGAAGTPTAVTGTGLTNNKWYFLYGYVDTGVIKLELTTTVPDTARVFKSGDTSRVYLGSARSDGAGALFPFRAVRRASRYRVSATSSGNLQMLSSGSATTFTDVDLSTRVPPTARYVSLRAILVTGAVADDGYIRTKGDTTQQELVFGANIANWVFQREFEIETDSAQFVQYKVGDAGSDLDLYVVGYRE